MINHTTMNREIKFRGKRTDTGEWITGNLFTPNLIVKGVYICPETSYADFMPDFQDGDTVEQHRGKGIALGHFFEVMPETVGQYTGLKDKNGVEIFEGDIVYCNTSGNIKFPHTGPVEYLTESDNGYKCGYFAINCGGMMCEDTQYTHFCNNENFEVIGNIHDTIK